MNTATTLKHHHDAAGKLMEEKRCPLVRHESHQHVGVLDDVVKAEAYRPKSEDRVI